MKDKQTYNANHSIESKRIYVIKCVVDTSSSIVHYKDLPYMPRFRYALDSIKKIQEGSIIVTGFNSEWLIHLKNISMSPNDSIFIIKDSINFAIHSPAKLGIKIDKLPDTTSFKLIMTTYRDKMVEFDLWPGDIPNKMLGIDTIPTNQK